MLKVLDVSKEYKNGTEKLIAINRAIFSVQKGEVALIIGPSGSGKTTLVSMIGGLSSPTKGKIEILGQDITILDKKKLAQFRLQKIGFVFQNFKLLQSLTAEENVMVPKCCISHFSHKNALSVARNLLDLLGLQNRYQYPVEILSGGEKQRVAIARALINDPDLILADEPTASLDSQTGKKVTELLRDIAKRDNRTIIVVSHDPRIIPIADRIFKVEDGFVMEGRE